MRVDLYDVDGTIVFGEFTPYPISGQGRFTPASFDTELGKAWTLPICESGAGSATAVTSCFRGRASPRYRKQWLCQPDLAPPCYGQKPGTRQSRSCGLK